MRLWVYQSLAKTRWNLSLPLHPHPPNSSPLWWHPWTRSETTKSPYSSKPSSRETFHWYLTFIYLSNRDMCGIFYETCHFNIILLFMDHFILLGDVSHEMEQHWPREWSFLPRGCGWPGAVSPLVSVPKVFIPTAGQIKKNPYFSQQLSSYCILHVVWKFDSTLRKCIF